MPTISVLTSVYNESPQEICQAIRSIQEQTYPDWELILVNDNPKQEEMSRLLSSLTAQDSRIRLLTNPKNLGLARSMNRAAAAARGTYLARMDADDISAPTRLEEELSLLIRENCGLVCCCFQTIDDQGKILCQNSPYYTPRQLHLLLPYQNIIHHPTVLMKKELFFQAGGYRPYPCAQDYDLWLRFLNMKVKMAMHRHPLLFYRIRAKSTTGQRRYLQALTLNYLRKAFREGQADLPFLPDAYGKYLRLHGYHSPKAQRQFAKATCLLQSSHSRPLPARLWLYARAALLCEVFRRNFLYQIQVKRLKRC